MQVRLYYRTFGSKLGMFQDEVREGETVGSVIAETKEQLDLDNTLYIPPVLALIQGGKN